MTGFGTDLRELSKHPSRPGNGHYPFVSGVPEGGYRDCAIPLAVHGPGRRDPWGPGIEAIL
jgi:hypothetical protein